ncbi:MAG: redox-regulated ATPase YchF [Patescibacteria group bacterium]|nr:redox-regulated ATPase YchF [Patescibacteria group bacterium]
MDVSVGIVGLPNAGKSTLFNALLGRSVANTAPYAFCTIEPNVGVVEVKDEHLDQLAEVLNPKEKIPAAIEFVDIAGLVKGAHEGEGLGNEFLSHIRNVDVVLHLVRAFEGEGVERVGGADPAEDLQTVNTELLLKDLERISKFQIQSAGRRTKFQKGNVNKRETIKKRAVEKVSKVLEEGRLAVEAKLTEEEEEAIEDLNLLTMKPQLVVANIDEAAAGEAPGASADLPAGKAGLAPEAEECGSLSSAIPICAKLEEDLADFTPEERKEYLEGVCISESALDKVIRGCYNLLELITFYTVKGGEIVRAWPIKKGSSVLRAAEIVHSDFAENFIRAEVVQVQELIEAGSWLAAKEQGIIDVRGRDYIVHDSDVVEFKI